MGACDRLRRLDQLLVEGDQFGVRMSALLNEMKTIDDKSFEIRLKRLYAHMLDRSGLHHLLAFVAGSHATYA